MTMVFLGMMLVIANITAAHAGITDTKAEVSSWDELEARLIRGGTLVLTQDITRTSSYDLIVRRKTIIDLNGHTLNGDYSEYEKGSVILVNGNTLTIQDNSEQKTGVLTGGYTSDGGGAVELLSGTGLIIEGGTISGNDSDAGGAISISPGCTVEMRGGVIENHSAGYYGGAIYILFTGK